MVGVFAFICVSKDYCCQVASMGSISDRMDEAGEGEEEIEQQKDEGEGFCNV